MRREQLGFADIVVGATPGEEALRSQKSGDVLRTRHTCEFHIRLRTPPEEWYRCLDLLEPDRVV